MTNFIETMQAEQAKRVRSIDALRASAQKATASEARDMRAKADALDVEYREVDERITELQEQESRAAKADAARAAVGHVDRAATDTYSGEKRSVFARLNAPDAETRSRARAQVMSEPATYHPGNATEVSFLRDMVSARRGDWQAAERLNRHKAETGDMEVRVDMTTGAGTGGSFVPPQYLIADYVAVARAGRPTANLLTSNEWPMGHGTVQVPRLVPPGTSTAVQPTEGTTLSDTPAQTSLISVSPTTIAGKQSLSRQLLDFAGGPIDQIVLADLAASSAVTLNQQVVSGSGAAGQMTGLQTAGQQVAFTSTTPVVAGATPGNSFQAAVRRAANAVSAGRYAAPTVLVMRPERWNWCLEAVDSSNRPLVVPSVDAGAFNAHGSADGPFGVGAAGVFAGLPVVVDPTLPNNITNGTTNNCDIALVLRAPDLWLWETSPVLEVFDAPLADSMQLLLRSYTYAGMAVRYAASAQVVGGSGMGPVTL